MNTIRGCTKFGDPNFSFSANVDDGSCKQKADTITAFGGAYQTCSPSGEFEHKNPCKDLEQTNPKTGGYSCPNGYKAVELPSGSVPSEESIRKCHKIIGLFKSCKNVNVGSTGNYRAFWCAADEDVKPESGYLFGGLYTNVLKNPVTQTKGCPPNFYALKLLRDLSICVSDDFEMGTGNSLPFAGFFSCHSGNPLTVDNIPPNVSKNSTGKQSIKSLALFMSENFESQRTKYGMRCPDGYSQHLAFTTLENCPIHYCIRTGTLSGPLTPPVKRPPFVNPPAIIKADKLVQFNDNTQKWEKMSVSDQSQLLGLTNDAEEFNINGEDEKSDVLNLSAGGIVGIVIGAAVFCSVLTAAIVVAVQKRRVRRSYTRLSHTPLTGNYGTSGPGTPSIPDAVVSGADC